MSGKLRKAVTITRRAIIPRPISEAIRFMRMQRLFTAFLGPLYRPESDIIQIDLTYSCDLNCFNCNKSCTQARSDDNISAGQIKSFIDESIAQKRRYERIEIMGGEPTLHPELPEIVGLLMDFIKTFSPKTVLWVVTNGFSPASKAVLGRLPVGAVVINTDKHSRSNNFCSFNMAPIDSKKYRNADYSNGCGTMTNCGKGLNRYGYYVCSVAAGIDRVLGLDVGVKELPARDDLMIGQRKALCGYCGFFKAPLEFTATEEISGSWRQTYDDYGKNKPVLSVYGHKYEL